MNGNFEKEKELLEKVFEMGLEYNKNISKLRVTPNEYTRSLLKKFDEAFPEKSISEINIINQLNEYGSPNTVAQTGGRYFGFVNGATFPVGLSARLLADFWDQNSALEVMTPIVAHLETVVEKWLIELLELPDDTAASFVSGTSMSNFCGLAAARWRICEQQGWDIRSKGLFGCPPIKVVMSEEGHGSVVKALNLLGIGEKQISRVPCDDQGRLIPELIPDLDTNTILVLQAGNVNSGSFDPTEIACKKAIVNNTWVHIDGAFGLWAAGTSKFKHLTRGHNLATSWSLDAHKTLNSPYDNGILMCRDKEALLNAMYASGAYIQKGHKRDSMYYTPEMSRRSRVIELWAILKQLGRQGIEQLVGQLHERAIQFARELRAHGFDILNEVVFNQVLARYQDDKTTELILKEIQDSGVCWCGPSVWKNNKVIRISVCSWRTDSKDVSLSVDSFAAAKKKISGNTNL